MKNSDDTIWFEDAFAFEINKIIRSRAFIPPILLAISLFLLVIVSTILTNRFPRLLAIIFSILAPSVIFLVIYIFWKQQIFPIRVGYSNIGIYYTTKDKRKGFVPWSDVISINPLEHTRNREYAINFYKSGNEKSFWVSNAVGQKLEEHFHKFLKEKERNALERVKR